MKGTRKDSRMRIKWSIRERSRGNEPDENSVLGYSWRNSAIKKDQRKEKRNGKGCGCEVANGKMKKTKKKKEAGFRNEAQQQQQQLIGGHYLNHVKRQNCIYLFKWIFGGEDAPTAAATRLLQGGSFADGRTWGYALLLCPLS